MPYYDPSAPRVRESPITVEHNIPGTPNLVTRAPGGIALPALIAEADDRARERFLEFFAATIRNRNTRKAYARAVADFLAWCDTGGLTLTTIRPLHVAAYIERLTAARAKPTVKQHLAAIRMCLDWMTAGGTLELNPAASVRGPKHIVKRGSTPVLTADEARQLLDSIPLCRKHPETGEPDPSKPILIGLRDRALIGVMAFSFARIGAVLGMKVEDYYTEGRRGWFRLHEKGGKLHHVPAHHNAEDYLDAYIAAAGIAEDRKGPLFRTIDRRRRLTDRPLSDRDARYMVKRRARAAGLPEAICNHTFRATGITAYLENNGTIEHAQRIAAHESPKTTKLYDRTGDEITLDEVERIVI
jgi:site-specific recombinase XerD